jgi:hypothetical protein
MKPCTCLAMLFERWKDSYVKKQAPLDEDLIV